MQNSTFQVIVLSVFGFFIVAGLVALALFKGGGGATDIPVVVWGTVPASSFQSLLPDESDNKAQKVEYVEKSEDTFDQNLIEALASGKGPDAFLLPQDMILRYRDKIYPISYESLSERDFKDTFIQEAELYLFPEGIMAMPFSVDPLVMYWNRDLFANAGLSSHPKYWDEFLTLPDVLTVKDGSQNISKSAVALGEFGNIANAKEIISIMLIQAGNPIVRNEGAGMRSSLSGDLSGAGGAVDFYTSFGSPLKTVYSWNRGMTDSKKAFINGDLAVYFGFASEMGDIASKSPYLNFDVAYFPEVRDAKTKITFGKMQGVAISKATKNFEGAWDALVLLSGEGAVKKWVNATNLPPVRRDLIFGTPSDANLTIFYNSALRARGWLDPNKKETGIIFRDMIESITSGRMKTSEALSRAGREIDELLQ